MANTHVIGIAGGSGSGKSSLLKRILAAVSAGEIAVLAHDSYYRNLSGLTLEERSEFNFDHPDALETPLLCEHLDGLRRGESISQPVYDFSLHARRDETVSVGPCKVVVVEGILVLADPELRSRMDLKIFVDTKDDLRLARRIKRDIVKRGRSVESVLKQYHETVRPMHQTFVEPSRVFADLIVPEGGHNPAAIAVLIDHIRAVLSA